MWTKVEKRRPKTVRRYRLSSAKLLRVAPQRQIVKDLDELDWDDLASRWPDKDGREGKASPSDWMHLYRAVSRFLTVHLGGGRVGEHHPWRAKVMDLLPRKRERKRVPDLPPAVFLRVVARTPEDLRPAYVTLAATGLRLGEFLALERSHLRAGTFEIEVPGAKTDDSAAIIPIDPKLWTPVSGASTRAFRRPWCRPVCGTARRQ
jgi:integrase